MNRSLIWMLGLIALVVLAVPVFADPDCDRLPPQAKACDKPTTTSSTTSSTMASTTTTEPTTTTTATTTTIPAGIPISPGQSIQSAVNANPAGTTFVIKAGVHTQQTVAPKSDQRFIGEPGAILDGQNITADAFQGDGDRVVIQGLVIRNYNNPLQTGVLRSTGGAYDWLIENNEMSGAGGASLHATDGWTIRGNNIHHNHYAGVFCRGNNITFENNTIAYNNTDLHDPNWEAAGLKCFTTINLVIRGNHAHDNYGPGLWTDWDHLDSLYENNIVHDNCGPGIFHEASFDAVIRNNTVDRNGDCNASWVDGAGILVNTSKNVTITGNTVRDNHDGIGITYTDRGTSSLYGIREVRNLLVENNTVVMSEGQTGLVTNLATNDMFSTMNNRFEGNTYTNTGPATAWAWARQSMTFTQWQAAGHDN